MMGGIRSLTGKHALVTGGGRGIGAAIAQALLHQGARVTLLGRNPEALRETEERLSLIGDVHFVVANIADHVSVMQAFADAVRQAGPIDILVNNAGQASSASFVKMDEALWQQMLSVNLNGTFHCMKAALPGMLQAGWGRIVNVASTAGLTGYGYVSAYCAAKHGVIGLTRSVAIEVATKGVTVNAVCPGYTETDILRDAIANIAIKTQCTEEEALVELASKNPQQRLVQPEEVANAVVWLCLPESSAMNGQAIAVAGGEVM